MFRPLMCFVVMVCSGWVQAEPLQVLSSIRPLQLLVAEIGGERVQATVLLDPTRSPHHYQFRPSERLRLARADAVIWVGPALETFLAAPLRQLDDDTPVLGLHHAETNALGGHDPGEHGHDHAHDAHIWLSPPRAMAMAADIAQLLSDLDPAGEAFYRERQREFARHMAALDSKWSRELEPLSERGFLVVHPAYGYFVEHYRLNQVGALSASPELPPGARHLLQLRRRVQAGDVSCVLRERQFADDGLDTIIAGSAVATAMLDPLASTTEPEKGAFAAFFDDFAAKVRDCLRPGKAAD